MKILYICRIFSGLSNSIKEKRWMPTGVPTIYKMIEKIDSLSFSSEFIFTDWISNENKTSLNLRINKKIKLNGLKSEILLVSGLFFGNFFVESRIMKILIEIKRQFSILFSVIRFNPDIIYVDRANLISGAICSRFLRKKVVLRIMGIYPSMWEILDSTNFFNIFLKWCLKSSFSLVICTEDGSGGRQWMNRALNENVKRINLLNGVDILNSQSKNRVSLKKINKNKINVLFKGRFEKIKGCYEFINGISYLDQKTKRKINIIMIGTGSEEKKILKLVEKKKLKNIFFHFKNVPHKKIYLYHNVANIYVSLNQAGNLSNSNLECFKAGICSIIPVERKKFFRDINIKKYFDENDLIRIPWKNQEKELSVILKFLINNKSKIKFYSKNIHEKSKKVLISWNKRIGKELKLLKEIYEN